MLNCSFIPPGVVHNAVSGSLRLTAVLTARAHQFCSSGEGEEPEILGAGYAVRQKRARADEVRTGRRIDRRISGRRATLHPRGGILRRSSA